MQNALLVRNFNNHDNKENITLSTIRECMNILIDHDCIFKRSEIKKLDTIDVTNYAEGNDFGVPSAMPMMSLSDSEKEAVDKNWYLTIPPLISGVLRINTARYLKYEITEINIDEQNYSLTIVDYGFDNGVWLVNNAIAGTIYIKENGNITHSKSGIRTSDLLEEVFIYKSVIPDLKVSDELLERIRKDVVKPLKDFAEEDNDYDDVLNHFITAIIRVNTELSNGKRPKAMRGSSNKTIKTAAGPVEKNPKPQIVRTLDSGVSIKSVKIPKAPTLDSVRHYKIASWTQRGHLRHYKTGKVVYIKPAIKERKCLKGNAEGSKRQIIMIAGRKSLQR